MPILRSALTALLLGAATPAFVASAFAQTCACPQTEGFQAGPVIQADEAPPPLPVYEQPPIPAPGYVWTPGYWGWNNYDYYWVPGVWVEPAQTGLLWTPGYWAFVGGAYLFHQGYWGQHVGFYGGVNYGYGYNGLGYEGGRWEGNRFLYNTTVNNFGGLHVTNVYSQTVVAAPGAGRASFNGGPGGIALKPTPEQERLTAEAHVRPTQLQVTHARMASMDATQFHANNKGKPAVAATERPGDLKGPGAVPAKAAGSAEVAPEPGAPNPEQKVRPGEKPPGDNREAPGAAKPEEKLPGNAAPAEARPPAGEKPGRPETQPERPQGAAKPEAPKPEAKPTDLERPQPPKAMERPEPPRPAQPAPPAHEPPHAQPRPEERAQPRPGPQNRPEHKECRPGEPNCK